MIFKNSNVWAISVGLILILCGEIAGCSRSKEFTFDELFSATAVVLATPVGYAGEPDLSVMTTGVPTSKVLFHLDERLSGKLNVDDAFALNGYLSDQDDYNDVEMPYRFVRPNGRSGSCFANTYRRGAQFLLFLKKTKDGLTTNISALGPSNEQLRGRDDPWLLWVRKEIDRRKKSRS